MTITSSLRFLYILGESGLLCATDKKCQYLRTATIKEFMVFNLLPVSMAVVTMRFGISAPLSIMVGSVRITISVTMTIT